MAGETRNFRAAAKNLTVGDYGTNIFCGKRKARARTDSLGLALCGGGHVAVFCPGLVSTFGTSRLWNSYPFG